MTFCVRGAQILGDTILSRVAQYYTAQRTLL
jgi:hypothetical protein